MKNLPVLSSLQVPDTTKNDVSEGEAEEDDAPCEVQAEGCTECSQQVVRDQPLCCSKEEEYKMVEVVDLKEMQENCAKKDLYSWELVPSK